MISIIICSRESSINELLTNNIKETVGSKYELIILNNSENQYSIFQAYNLGIEKSTGELLCFLHDDILIHTKNWGNILERIFKQQPEVGLIGVAGSRLKTKMPSPWWNTFPEYSVINIIQHLKPDDCVKTNIGFNDKTEVEVVAIDGVFMVLKKSTGITFNLNASGFHNYDMYLSLENTIKGYKVMVTNGINIEHFSRGSMNKDWYISTIKFHQLYENYLPIYTGIEINSKALVTLEFINGSKFITQLLEKGLKKEALKCWIKLILLKPYSKFHLRISRKFLS
jgi:glycosyltransferase involved in cell wall biosynthesis